jgi:hypothetical protein
LPGPFLASTAAAGGEEALVSLPVAALITGSAEIPEQRPDVWIATLPETGSALAPADCHQITIE